MTAAQVGSPTPLPPDGCVSRKRAAQFLGIQVGTLDRWAQRDLLRVVRISRRTLVPVSELERLVRGDVSAPTPAPTERVLSHVEQASSDYTLPD